MSVLSSTIHPHARTNGASSHAPDRPRIGLLWVMEGYDASHPDLTERQGAYARDLVAALSDVLFPSPARTHTDIEVRV